MDLFDCYLTPNFDTSGNEKVSNYGLLNILVQPIKVKLNARETQLRCFCCSSRPSSRIKKTEGVELVFSD